MVVFRKKGRQSNLDIVSRKDADSFWQLIKLLDCFTLAAIFISIVGTLNNVHHNIFIIAVKTNTMDVIAFLLIISFIISLYFLVTAIRKQKKAKIKYGSGTSIAKLQHGFNQRNLGIANNFNHNLSKKLLNMLHGDEKAATRLLKSVREKNPDRTMVWCQERVISDLERDRRC